jgi:DNA primase large subunit
MDPAHARYPFLDSASKSVKEADIGLTTIITGEEYHPAVERGVERVRRALIDGTVRPDSDAGRRWNPRVELLSYPVARMLVLLLDTPGAVEKYASAEANTAYERFTNDFEDPDDGLKSTSDKTISLDTILAEFNLENKVSETVSGEGYQISVGEYLTLSSNLDGEQWRLINRALADGEVTITEDELHELLREAIRQRVIDRLPATVSDEIRAGLTDEVAELEDAFSEIEVARDIDALAPECFPPCITSLLERMRTGEDLPAHSEFALVSFLASANADDEDIWDLGAVEGDTARKAVRYRLGRVGDESGAQYAPPSCETMQAYGECPVADEADPTADSRCETIAHPLAYYEDALAEAGSVEE